ncbi:hypothetical protein N8I77_006995 [Diaporthe amygdali]|uniref:Uncharacterized protein n=1 Tax=Phomopsis amygdali TaxID=1214568 RepID=A0AAD9SC45_PHOAM|nr:hypothetical protein N8I77_006995 [Diaporthe amygdali]
MTKYIDYNVSAGVNIAFTAIMIPPLFVIMCISFYRARRSHDPARVTTAYFKAMLPVAILWLLMYTIQGILSIIYERSYSDTGGIYHASLRTSLLGTLFSYITNLLLIMTLAELGNGFLFCLTQTRTALQKAVRYAAIASCIILSMLAIAIFGVYNAEYSRYLSDWWYRYDEDSLYEASRKMNVAFNILTFVWALLLVAFAAVVFNKTKHNYILKDSAVLFLVAAILNFVTQLYTLIYLSVFVLADFYLYDRYETYTALMFVDPVINDWIYTAVVSLVFVIVIRKRNGLWTTVQPWMDQEGPPALAANPIHKGRGEQWQQPSNSHVLGV